MPLFNVCKAEFVDTGELTPKGKHFHTGRPIGGAPIYRVEMRRVHRLDAASVADAIQFLKQRGYFAPIIEQVSP